ncbi:LysR family transcriptional regulator YeiE [Pseudomonas chlororaphis subsp. piscium]|uniref:LysR substrate-binding domain-containing protein n=1 Tax=Pseudomonas chlororaphis TaxID=587753 RepID=UPI00087A4C51|nr:LysR substrate-binding domain-containing protein [Pseudomonas chlororaphis]AZC31831.1 LysR family transcriptional regulator YeiE [Pseudomonas chlororaphis subsp. piscium]WDG89597.1 LysR substrate-binding domain-containing protein [Pseudomonas chlororaphis]SDS81166.1 DNA-binding transcriptional regulator, LysR family [Pseudomonas chlororaphis]
MNLHHLLVFHTTAKTGSITACAKALHISQPALSRELRKLEERFGLTLFERQPRGMRLTHAGEVLAEYADRLFDIARTADLAMKELASAKVGHLSIAASNTIGTYVLPRVLARFRRNNPGVKVSLFVSNTEQVAQAVADMRYSLGFIEGPLHINGLTATHFREDDLLPVVAAWHRLADATAINPRDLNDEPLLMREVGSGTRELIAAVLEDLDVQQGSIMEFGNTEAIKQAAIHGGGIAWLPAISITDELANDVLIPLPCAQLTLRRTLSIVRRAAVPDGPAERELLSLLEQ